MHVITYGHFYDGSLINGTLSDLDGVPKASWTFGATVQDKVRREQALDPVTFQELWAGLTQLEVFKRHQVRDPNRKVDPQADHVIWAALGEGPDQKRAMFAVPAGETDPAFLAWISKLQVPRPTDAPSVTAPAGSANSALRQQAYVEAFGSNFTVDRDMSMEAPKIDVYTFAPGMDGQGRERTCYTLVTSGMSDTRMNVPQTAPFKRHEIVIYAEAPNPLLNEVLRFLAKLPAQQGGNTWYSFGTTMSNGNPPQLIFEGSRLDNFFFIDCVYLDDMELQKKLAIDGDPAALIWVVPITSAECKFIMEKGPGELLNLFDEKHHPLVLDENRPCYVSGKGKAWWKFGKG
jgi:hypothetical protein